MNNVECESCVKRKTMFCPNSIECYETENKPYWQNRIMLLQENKELQEKINTYENPEDLTLMFMYCDEKAKDKIKELQNKIDKAIDIIDTYNIGKNDYSIPQIGIIELYEILKDSDVDE